jgi:hypothetical protein
MMHGQKTIKKILFSSFMKIGPLLLMILMSVIHSQDIQLTGI